MGVQAVNGAKHHAGQQDETDQTREISAHY